MTTVTSRAVDAMTTTHHNFLDASDTFCRRHVGPGDAEVAEMLRVIGVGSLDELIDQTVPAAIRRTGPLDGAAN